MAEVSVTSTIGFKLNHHKLFTTHETDCTKFYHYKKIILWSHEGGWMWCNFDIKTHVMYIPKAIWCWLISFQFVQMNWIIDSKPLLAIPIRQSVSQISKPAQPACQPARSVSQITKLAQPASQPARSVRKITKQAQSASQPARSASQITKPAQQASQADRELNQPNHQVSQPENQTAQPAN